MTRAEAAFWHKKLSEACGVVMQQNPDELDAEGSRHTFFTLLDEEDKPTEKGPET